jgi:hypothetical protein
MHIVYTVNIIYFPISNSNMRETTKNNVSLPSSWIEPVTYIPISMHSHMVSEL